MAFAAQVLERMRDTATRLFPQTGVITRKAYVEDGKGGQTETWSALASVACRMSPLRLAREVVQGERIVGVAGFRVLLPYGTDCLPSDRLQVGSEELEVLETNQGRADAITLEAFCRRVR